ncbi:PAN domain-containing protein [Sphingomonas sp. ST-64]|uniref:PAN domain-containing protein n=1 Tax=Sphingomonas plantiphila TaxID=3163295 RepID=A0ABW8YRM3_9SPHN
MSLAAAATLAPAATVQSSVGQIANGYIQEGDLYRSGNIIRTTTLSSPGQDAGTCRALCTANGDCNAYSYVQETASRKPVCYQRMIALPNQGTTRSHGYSTVVSGTKTSWARELGFTPHANSRVTGAKLLRAFVSRQDDPFECIQVCKRETGCQSASYVPAQVAAKKQAMCMLYDAPGTLVSAPGVLSASGSNAPPLSLKKRRPQAQPTAVPPRRTIEAPRRIDPRKLAPVEKKAPADGGEPDQFPGEMHDPQAA